MNTDVIKTLIAKAGDCHDAGEAMKFTQAALNAANALDTMAGLPQEVGQSNAMGYGFARYMTPDEQIAAGYRESESAGGYRPR